MQISALLGLIYHSRRRQFICKLHVPEFSRNNVKTFKGMQSIYGFLLPALTDSPAGAFIAKDIIALMTNLSIQNYIKLK